MILLTKGQTIDVKVTLNEYQTLSTPNYLFYFKHRGTNRVVAWVQTFASDTSLYKYRYNKFNVVVNTYFSNENEGFWDYQIYEQASAVNTDPTLANKLLEKGWMKLKPASAFTRTQYPAQNNTYTIYKG